MSYVKNMKIVLTSFSEPHFAEEFDQPISIEGQELSSVSDAWSLLRFLVSMNGLVINPKEVYSVRIESSQLSFGGKVIDFEKCHLFPSDKIKVDLKIKKVLNRDMYRVVDVMRLPFCNAQKLTKLRIDNCFIDEVKFYGKKRIACISELSKNQLNDFDYSDTMSKLYLEKQLLLEDDLIRPLISPSRGMRKPKPVVLERIVQPLEEVVYKSTKTVKYYDNKNRDIIIETYRRHNTGR